MSIRIYVFCFVLTLLGISAVGSFAAQTNQDVIFYTPYNKIVVPPGESINYTVDVINKSDQTKQVDLSISGLSKDWVYELKSGGYTIRQLSVLPNEKKSLTLKVVVPLKVNKGSHQFKLMANKQEALPLVIEVSKQGTYKTEFSIDQPSMQGHSASTFTYKAKLMNRTGEKQLYALETDAPRGWEVTFKVRGSQVASVNVDENNTEDLMIQVKPSPSVDAGTYKIPVRVLTPSTSASIQLEAVITGSYGIDLSTPTGLLSTKITAGETTQLDLIVKNTGSAQLNNIRLSATKPADWEVTFDPKNIEHLKAGERAEVTATLKASKKAIAGDYLTKLEVKAPEANSTASIRVAVRTSMLWGWIGILIIIIALGSVIYLFRKYGRR